MGVDLSKLSPEMRENVNLVKTVSLAKGINPDSDKAQVVATFDFSGSTEMGSNKLYSDGTMESINLLAAAAGFTFDDDGQIPASLFHNWVIDLGNIDPGNYDGFINRASKANSMGGTQYLPALRWIVETVGLGDVDLGRPGDSLFVRQQLPVAVYAYFVTDGEPTDDKEQIRAYLRLMSQLGIFVQFIGVGDHRFTFLKEINNLSGTLIDNCGFFDAKDVLGNRKTARRGLFGRSSAPQAFDEGMKRLMLEKMLEEFPSFYRKARTLRPTALIA